MELKYFKKFDAVVKTTTQSGMVSKTICPNPTALLHEAVSASFRELGEAATRVSFEKLIETQAHFKKQWDDEQAKKKGNQND